MSTTTRIPQPARRTGRAWGRALAACVLMAGILAGIPALLIRLAAALPLDPAALAPGALARTDDGGLLLLLLLAVAWLAWAALVASLVLELGALLRRVPAPRVAGLAGPQRLAAALVAALVVTGSAGPAAAATPTGPPLALVGTLAAAVATGDAVGTSDSAPAEPAEAELPRITTKRHDTLWLLAEQYLGSGERFAEIVELNAGAEQPDGRALGADGRVYPGWSLRLPADADLSSHRPDRHRVARGDTLWGIADEELGDPTRFGEIVELNAGDLQPDGRRLADPDLILPGWVLEVPGEPDGRSGPAPVAEPETTSDGGSAAGSAPPTSAHEESPHGSATQLPTLDRAAPGAEPGDEPDVELPTLDRAAPGAEPTGEAPAGESASPLSTLDRAVFGMLPGEQPTPGAELGTAPALHRASATAAPVAEAAILLPAGGAVAALLLTGLAKEVARRRRRFQRHRQPGERLAPLDRSARESEVVARTGLAESAPALLERALGQLAVHCRAAGRPTPRVRLVHLAADSIRLDLAEPEPEPIAPFRAADPSTWQLDPALLVDDDPQQDSTAAPFPGLVTLGCAGAETVLLNLTEVGTLRVAGPDPAAVLRGLAAELCLSPARGCLAPSVLLRDASATAVARAMEAGDAAVESEPRRVAAALAAAARRPAPDPQGDPLEVVLSDRPLGIEVPPRSGAALITTDPTASAGATLVLTDEGAARLDPEGLSLIPQSLAAPASVAIAGLLDSTALPDERTPTDDPGPLDGPLGPTDAGIGVATVGTGEQPAAAPDGSPAAPAAEPVVPVADPVDAAGPVSAAHPLGPAGSGAAAGARTAPEEESSPAPRLLLLGELRVANAHGRAESTRVGRLAETAAFVLLNPDSRPSELQAALWPGRRSNPQTCRQMISRTRTWLGRDPDGQTYLMHLDQAGQRLRLRPGVTSDWAEFQRLASAGLADPDDTAQLTQALGLVRGRPFGPTTARELPWADLHVNEMISLITDVAHELAVRHERAGRWALAREAVLRGLQTESESESLAAVLARLERRV